MHEIFSFRKELNIKKIIIISLVSIIVIGLLIWLLLPPAKETIEKIEENDNPNSIFYSENKIISLELPKAYNFTQYIPANNYIFELRNDDNLNIFVSEVGKIQNKELSDVVSADQPSYIANFNKYSNQSNISEFDLGGSKAYSYSFHYLDSKTKVAYYLQTIWLEKNDKYYILDIEFPLDSLSENSKIINDVLDSIIIN